MFLRYLLVFMVLLATSESEEYRIFNENTAEQVKNFYHQNHTFQTLDFVLQKEAEYLPLNKKKMGIWQAIELFDTLIDESDPDLDLPQRYHLFQTAEALRRDGHPRWLILTGFIHDLGKILTFYGEPQWAVVGDSFPVGCAYSKKIVFPNYFTDNPDMQIPIYQTKCGIYSEGCGLGKVHMSWGHDEYLYQVVKDYLPEEASFIIRYHSFWALTEGVYDHLLSERDRQMIPWITLFRRYDLYSKSKERLDIDALAPYYQELVSEFFPEELNW
jgi:inositol oxygenase